MSSDATDWLDGLTQQDAAMRLARDGPNEIPRDDEKQKFIRQVKDVLRQPMLALLLAAGSVNFLLSEPIDGAILMMFVLVVIGISLYQGSKTEDALAALRDLSSPRALVIRDGRQVRIPGREVVVGDVLIVAEGDRIAADAVLVEGRHVLVDESMLSGESIPVGKTATDSPGAEIATPGSGATSWLFSGTLVVKGHGVALVRAVGGRTQLGQIGTTLRDIRVQQTPLQVEIDRLVIVVAGIAMVAATVVLVAEGLVRKNWLEGALAGIATAMSMLPEEFHVVLTVFLALGAWRMSQRSVLTRRPPVIEALGSATVVCVDKTGTLTMNKMEVRELVVEGEHWAVDNEPLPERFHQLVENAVLASPVDAIDPTDVAFRSLANERVMDANHVHPEWVMIREYPLSDDILAVAHAWNSNDDGRIVIAAKGAPEAIAALCHLDKAQMTDINDKIEILSAGGLRVIAVASATVECIGDLPNDRHQLTFSYLGLAGLGDPVREGVPESIKQFQRAGVRTVMITGDHPGTALAVAREVGLGNCRDYLTGAQLDEMSDDHLASAVVDVDVFARMVPSQKLRLIHALKRNDEVVGMTGDGVNDAPALRASDIGIAMGGRGTDVAREAADLVIIDDNFSSIVTGVRHGRGILNNLRKALAYVVAVHVPIIGMVVIPIVVPGWPLVLLPVQIAFLELIIDPACSIVFGSEEADPAIMDQPPRAVGEPMFNRRIIALSLAQGLSVLFATLVVYRLSITRGLSEESVRSVSFAAIVMSNLWLILVNRSWRLSFGRALVERRNPTLKWIMIATVTMLACVLFVPIFRDAFEFGSISAFDAGTAMAASIGGVAWFEVYKLIQKSKRGPRTRMIHGPRLGDD